MNQLYPALLVVQQRHVLEPDSAALHNLHTDLVVPGDEVAEGGGDPVAGAPTVISRAVLEKEYIVPINITYTV